MIDRKYLLLFIFSCGIGAPVFLQSTHFTKSDHWRLQRKEIIFGTGASNFLGDLGGRNQVGTDGLMDFEYKATRYAVALGYRYQFARDWYLKWKDIPFSFFTRS